MPPTGNSTRSPERPDFSRPRPDFAQKLKEIKSHRIIANALIEGEQAKKVLRTMSVMDKLDLIDQKHAEFEAGLDKDAQALLERYDALDKKKDKVFQRRNSVVDVREKKFDDMDAALDRLSNSGNSKSSSGSSTGA